MISTVTLTGADDSIHPNDLLRLQDDYLFAEWAILFSTKRTGTPRYPSAHWIESLFEISSKLSLSAHLCGDYAKAILLGYDSFLQLAGQHFERIQINHNFTHNPVNLDKLHTIIKEWPQLFFIIQKNQSNNYVCKELENECYHNLNFLYDGSGGRGIKSNLLGIPINRHYTGYAGGLSPENIISECERINNFVVDTNVWIDMETHIRSNNDQLFDFHKVNKVLASAEKYIGLLDID